MCKIIFWVIFVQSPVTDPFHQFFALPLFPLSLCSLLTLMSSLSLCLLHSSYYFLHDFLLLHCSFSMFLSYSIVLFICSFLTPFSLCSFLSQLFPLSLYYLDTSLFPLSLCSLDISSISMFISYFVVYSMSIFTSYFIVLYLSIMIFSCFYYPLVYICETHSTYIL